MAPAVSSSYGVPIAVATMVRLPPASRPLAFPGARRTMRLVRSTSSAGFFGGDARPPAGSALITTRLKFSSEYGSNADAPTGP